MVPIIGKQDNNRDFFIFLKNNNKNQKYRLTRCQPWCKILLLTQCQQLSASLRKGDAMFIGTPELIAQRREEIINACEKLYQTMSFKEITLKEIGNETSFSRPAIYNYFQTK
ncbi:MAG: TetR/AcrR family transcriptional regulator, partial [Anaerolineaceae bacterium]|nr:TetR/AcrR family transcriptional regulator [Anaerolineaceae bacterium]